MKKSFFNLTVLIKSLLVCGLLFTLSITAKASHVVGMDLLYTHIVGDQYKLTVVMYGNCGTTTGAFETLPYTQPIICIYDGNTYVTSVTLTIDTPTNPHMGIEITPVCPSSLDSTQCTNTSYPLPGIKKFVYTAMYTVPHTSHYWRFCFAGPTAAGSLPGRAAAITNIFGGTTTQLIDTLDNVGHYNSSPVLTQPPTPFFCLNDADTYNPVAIDPDGDSLSYFLVPGMDGSAYGSCPSSGWTISYVTYTGTAWTGVPVSATTPLNVTAGTFVFGTTTGQLDFVPNALQRSLVVYNMREYRHDTLVGTCQREMTFVVIACANVPPTGAMTGATGGGSIAPDSVNFNICQNSGPFTFHISPREPSDTNNHIFVTSTGMPAGCTLTVTNDSTNHPDCLVTWNSNATIPGSYVFYLNFTDDNCPVNGRTVKAFSINILPVPAISLAVVSQSSCTSSGIVTLIPGGAGSPWVIDVIQGGTTIQTYPSVTGVFSDTLAPGIDTFKIYSHVSTLCGVDTFVNMPVPPPFILTDTFSSPIYCGGFGTIDIKKLPSGAIDTVTYLFNGTPGTMNVLIGLDSIAHLTGLPAGIYSNIKLKYGTCVSNVMGPDTLINPPFTMSYVTETNPTICGFCNGEIILHGLHPGQTDTVNYTFNGVPQTAVSAYVSTDSLFVIQNACAGSYAGFVAHSGSCTSNSLTPPALTAPSISSGFDTLIHLGCKGDTVKCTNLSTPDSGMIYTWTFGDGTPADTNKNPTHIYYGQGTYTIKLILSNTRCFDSTLKTITLSNFVHADDTIDHSPICQGSTVNFTNRSTGTGNSYVWSFGDGATSTAVATTTHFYPHSSVYKVMLIATNDVPCRDTNIQYLYVDSASPAAILATDTIFCRGGAVTFTGDYTQIGNLGVSWEFGDGDSMQNVNPVIHGYEATGTITVNMVAYYRACPNISASKTINVIPYPQIYLGGDTAICPGSDMLTLMDKTNIGNPNAHWRWNTGDSTASVNVTLPGNYYATVRINGCELTDTILVKSDCYMNVPNVFTPNGDGINDYFFPRQLLTSSLVTFKMDIYNRWGQLIFETTRTDGRGWDGNLNDIQQPEGVYIYIIEATFKDGEKEKHQGNITLLR